MKKVQFCSGPNHLIGWENFDANIDIRNRLPFKENSVDFIFIEHGIEHITQYEALGFLDQCETILKPGGVVRVTFPDVEKIFEDKECQEKYCEKWGLNYSENKRNNAIATNIYNWQHKSFWTVGAMGAAMCAAELSPYPCLSGMSDYKELQDIERHWKFTFGDGKQYTEQQAKKIENLHTSTVEGRKNTI